MTKDPFVTEVVRIIKEHPLCKKRPHAIVLVSFKFYNAAMKQVDTIQEEIFGYLRARNDSLWLHNCLIVLPVPWLNSYEFEIKHAIPPKTYSDEELGMLV